MTRVLVVHHDVDMADNETDALRRAGYEVEQCTGPTAAPCPVPRGLPCAAIEHADVLMYDVWSTGDSDGGRRLVADIRRRYPGIPVVLTANGMELDWVEEEGPQGVVAVVGAAGARRLAEAVEAALASASRGGQIDGAPATSTT